MNMVIFTCLRTLRPDMEYEVPFLDYQSLLRKIPNCWRDLLNENKQFGILNRFNVKCNMYVKETLKEKKDVEDFMTL